MTPWTVVHQAPLSMGFPRQDYWSRLPCPSPGDLSGPGIKLTSLAWAGGFLTTEPPRKPSSTVNSTKWLETIHTSLVWYSRNHRSGSKWKIYSSSFNQIYTFLSLSEFVPFPFYVSALFFGIPLFYIRRKLMSCTHLGNQVNAKTSQMWL